MTSAVGKDSSSTIRNSYMDLPQFGKVQAEYIWIGGSGHDLRSKTKTLNFVPTKPEDLPVWNYDGSSTGQATGKESEILLFPVAIFRDPIRRGENVLVMCETFDPKTDKPAAKNHRAWAKTIFDNQKVVDEEYWFGLEQEYTLFDGIRPLGWPENGFPAPQGPYYCGTGADRVYGREVAEAHYRACLYAGLNVSGINAEVMPGQWEFQIGPSVGISAGDEMWVARYLLYRVAEDFGVTVSLDPKPMTGDWNGAGMHTNVSSQTMRSEGGLKTIMAAMEKLKATHEEHIKVYGEGNERRLSGHHETSDIHSFSYGIGNRGTSIRIGNDTAKAGKGYFEDRRPASNADPYLVTAKIVETVELS